MLRYIKKLLGMGAAEPAMTDLDKDILDDFYKSSGIPEGNPYEDMPEPNIRGNPNSDKSIIIMDDQDVVFYLYDLDFKNVYERFGKDILAEYKIVECSGPFAGFMASKYVNESDDNLVIAILDLTLGKIIKSESGLTIFDGVDIALEIIQIHPKCKIGLCTAHMLTADNPSIRPLIDKFNSATGSDLLTHAFSKSSDRAQRIHDMVADAESGHYTNYSNP